MELGWGVEVVSQEEVSSEEICPLLTPIGTTGENSILTIYVCKQKKTI